MTDKFNPTSLRKIEKLQKFLKEQYQFTIDIHASADKLEELRQMCIKNNNRISLKESKVHLNPAYLRNTLTVKLIDLILSENQNYKKKSNVLENVVSGLKNFVRTGIKDGIHPATMIKEAIETYKESNHLFDTEEVASSLMSALSEDDAWSSVSPQMQRQAELMLKKFGVNNMEIDKNAPQQKQVHSAGATGPTDTAATTGAKKPNPFLKNQPEDEQGAETMNLHPRDPFSNKKQNQVANQKLGSLQGVTLEMSEDLIQTLNRLVESEVNEAEVLVAAKGFAQELQTMIEKLGRLQNEDLGPVADRMKEVYGEETGSQFHDQINQEFQAVLDSLKETRDNITNVIGKIADGQGMLPSNDMDLDFDQDLDQSTDDGLDANDEFAGADAGAMEEPLGRMKKESAKNLKKAIIEMRQKIEEAKKKKKKKKKKKSVAMGGAVDGGDAGGIGESILKEGKRKTRDFAAGSNGVSAKLYWDGEWEEYVVRFYRNGKHLPEWDYHTTDENDAIRTAEHEVNKGGEATDSPIVSDVPVLGKSPAPRI